MFVCLFSVETSTPNQTATSATKTTNGEYFIRYKVAIKLRCSFCYVYFAKAYYVIHFSALVTAKPQDSSEGKTALQHCVECKAQMNESELRQTAPCLIRRIYRDQSFSNSYCRRGLGAGSVGCFSVPDPQQTKLQL